MKLADLFTFLGRRLSWHRRLVAGICAGLAMLCLGLAFVQPAENISGVVVTTRELTPGHKLGLADLKVAQFLADTVPTGAFTNPSDLVGKTITGGLSSGQPVTEANLLNRTRQAGSNHVLVPIRIRDSGIVSLLQVGDRISIYAAQPGGSPVQLASSVVVSGLPEPSTDQASFTHEGALVVVATTHQTAANLSAVGDSTNLSIALS